MKILKNKAVKWGTVIASGICAVTLLVYVNKPFDRQEASLILSMDSAIEYTAAYSELYRGLIESEELFQASEERLYKLTINEHLTYYFNSAEEVAATLELVLSASIDDTFSCDVTIDQEDDTFIPLISFTEQPVLGSNLNELTLTGTSNSEEKDFPIMTHLKLSEDTLGVDVTDFNFNENIDIGRVKPLGQWTVTPEEAATALLRTNVTPSTYTVTSGDSPSVIASDYDMSLTDLYQLNEGLKSNSKSLQIGDTLIVERLIPELSVIVKSMDIHLVPIPYDTIYQDDDSVYKGLKVTADPGYNGVMRVTDEVEICNDEEISRITIDEELVSHAGPKLILIGTKPIPATGSVGFFIKPLTSYRLSSLYGPRWGRMHNGIDMAVPTGSSVRAADGGTVSFSGWKGGYGYMVEIKHNDGMMTRYAHNSKLLVSVGQEVGQGQIISKSGNTGTSTGPHLHFEVLKDGDYVNPLDYF